MEYVVVYEQSSGRVLLQKVFVHRELPIVFVEMDNRKLRDDLRPAAVSSMHLFTG